VTSLYADLFHRPKIGGTNQIAVTKAMHSWAYVTRHFACTWK